MTGRGLKQKLEATKMKQVEIAGKLGMSKQSLSNILNSDSHVSTELLERLCVALNKDMTFFYPTKPVTQTTSTFTRAEAHNLHTGNGDINENKDQSDALTIALQQNAELIALLKAEKGL